MSYLDLDLDDVYSGYVDPRRNARALATRDAILEQQCEQLKEHGQTSWWIKLLLFIILVLLLWWLFSALANKKSTPNRGGSSYGSYGQSGMNAAYDNSGYYGGGQPVVSRMPSYGGYGQSRMGGGGGGVGVPLAAAGLGALAGAAVQRASNRNTIGSDVYNAAANLRRDYGGAVNSRTAAAATDFGYDGAPQAFARY